MKEAQIVKSCSYFALFSSGSKLKNHKEMYSSIFIENFSYQRQDILLHGSVKNKQTNNSPLLTVSLCILAALLSQKLFWVSEMMPPPPTGEGALWEQSPCLSHLSSDPQHLPPSPAHHRSSLNNQHTRKGRQGGPLFQAQTSPLTPSLFNSSL